MKTLTAINPLHITKLELIPERLDRTYEFKNPLFGKPGWYQYGTTPLSLTKTFPVKYEKSQPHLNPMVIIHLLDGKSVSEEYETYADAKDFFNEMTTKLNMEILV